MSGTDRPIPGIQETVTQLIVEDDLEPVEKGRVSFVLYSTFYKLWRVLFLITRVAMAYFALLSSVLLSIAILNGLIGFIFNFYLPRALGLSSDFLVGLCCILSVMAFSSPVGFLIFVSFSMIPEVWSAEEFPRTRIMLTYIRTNLKETSLSTLDSKWSIALQFTKLLVFAICILVSLIIGEGVYGIIETFVLGGCVLGLTFYVIWVPVVMLTKLAMYFKKDLLFPDTSMYRSFQFAREGVLKNRTASGQKLGIITVSLVMALHGVVTALVLGKTLQELGSEVSIISAGLGVTLLSIFCTYWVLFSVHHLDVSIIPSPNEEPDIVLRVEKNLKLLNIQPVPPRQFPISLLIITLMLGVTAAVLVLAVAFQGSVFTDTCNQPSTLGLDEAQFPNGTRTSPDLSGDLESSVCRLRWHSGTLNALDMALLAQAAYEDNENGRGGSCSNLSAVTWLNAINGFKTVNGQPGNDWEVRSVYLQRLVARYFELYSPSRGVTVFVVRGDRSEHTGDILETFDMYAPSACFQFISTFIPLALSLPASKVSNLLYYVSFTDRLFQRPLATYYQVVAEGIRAALSRPASHKWHIPSRTSVYVTGHGLGGAVAKVAASTGNVNITAVSFNGPGLLYSARSFGIEASTVETNVNNIVTTNNRLALLVDLLGGSTFRIDCLSQSLTDCHGMRAIICKLLQLCKFPDYNFLC